MAFVDAMNSSTNVSLTCEEARLLDQAEQQQRLLAAARRSAEEWVGTTASISATSLALDFVLLIIIFRLRRHRPLQRVGVSFCMCILVGCMFGHAASLMDGVPPKGAEGAQCRGRLAIMYMFVYLMIAPLFGKLVSLCRSANSVLLAGYSTGWDKLAKRLTIAIALFQLVMVVCYLIITAGKPFRADRLQTVCSEYVSEHAFHFVDGAIAVRVARITPSHTPYHTTQCLPPTPLLLATHHPPV